MASVSIETLYAAPVREPAALGRIRRLALPFELAFALLAGLALALFLLILLMAYLPGRYVTFNSQGGWLTFDPSTAPPDGVVVQSLPLVTQLAGLMCGSLIYGALIFALWSLRGLFSCYRKGEVFGARPIRLMRRAGVLLVLFAAMPGLLQPALRALGSPDRNWFHSETLPILLTGAGLLVFANIIALGTELQRENQEFV